MAGHIVTAPLVIARSQDDTDVYLYRGAMVPPLKAGEIARLREGEFIDAVPDPVEAVIPTPAVEPEPVKKPAK